MASLKVGSRLSYQAAVWGRTAPTGARASSSAQTATKENNPSSAGIVRRMARSVLRNACGSLPLEGSRTSTQRIGPGGKPE